MDVGSSSQADVKTSIVPESTIMDPTEIVRAEIARILGNTLNGAIQELGYFPGIVHALADVRAEVNKLRDQNGKLVSDNTTLSRIIAQQKEDINQLASQAASPDAHIPIIQGLQYQIQQLKLDREKLMHSQSQYLQENRFLHIELERITAGTWHATNNLIPPSQLMKQQPMQQNHISPSSSAPVMSPNYPPHQSNEPKKRPSLTFVPLRSAPQAAPSRSSQSSPTTPAAAEFNAWKHYRPVPNGLPQPPPSSTSPVVGPNGHPRNRSVTMPAFGSPQTGPSPMNPPTYGYPGAPRKTSAPVIDLTRDDHGAAPAGAVQQPIEQRAMKRRRTEDDTTLLNTSGSTHMDMRTVGRAIHSVEQQIKATTSTTSSAPTTPAIPQFSGTTPSGGVAMAQTAWPASASMPPFAENVVTAEPEATMDNAEAEDEEDEDMTDIWDEDGLVRIEICLDTAFDEVDGKMICKMCELRSQKFDGKPSDPMVDTSQSALVKHCEEEHPAGWGTLRKGNRE